MAKRYYDKQMMKREQYTSRQKAQIMYADDSGMIPDAMNKFSCLPDQVIMKEWPGREGYMEQYIPSAFKGVNQEMRASHNAFKKTMDPSHI